MSIGRRDILSGLQSFSPLYVCPQTSRQLFFAIMASLIEAFDLTLVFTHTLAVSIRFAACRGTGCHSHAAL